MASKQETSAVKQVYSEILNDLFKVDVNSESLKVFLENIVNAVNAQSKLLSSFQTELSLRPTVDDVERGLRTVAESVEIRDTNLLQKVNAQLDRPKPENTGKRVQDAANHLGNKITLLGTACSVLNKSNRDWEDRLQELAFEIPKKLDKGEMKAKVKKTKTKLLSEIDDLRKKLTKQVDDQGRKSGTAIAKFEADLKEVEKKTLWKIQDCESLLTKRITAEFVDNAVKGLEDKLRREIGKSKEEGMKGLAQQIEDLEDKMKSLETSTAEKLKNLRTAQREIEELFTSRFVQVDKFDSNKKNIDERISNIESKLVALDRKGDANVALDEARDLVRAVEVKIYDLQRALNELKDTVEHTRGVSSSSNSSGESCADPHLICLLEANVKRLRDELAEQKRTHVTFDADMRRRFDTFEHKLIGNLSIINNQQPQNSRSSSGSEFNRDEMIALIERAKVVVETRVKAVERELEDLKPKISSFADLEKKIKKKFREIQESQDLIKQISDKADQLEVNRANGLLDDRMRGLTDQFSQFRREFEQIHDFYRHISAMIQSGQQEAISVITGNTKIIPNRCVACGNKGKQVHCGQDLRGVDGKIYKVDINGSSGYDNQDVYDVYPQQFSPERAQKQSIISYKDKVAYTTPRQDSASRK